MKYTVYCHECGQKIGETSDRKIALEQKVEHRKGESCFNVKVYNGETLRT